MIAVRKDFAWPSVFGMSLFSRSEEGDVVINNRDQLEFYIKNSLSSDMEPTTKEGNEFEEEGGGLEHVEKDTEKVTQKLQIWTNKRTKEQKEIDERANHEFLGKNCN